MARRRSSSHALAAAAHSPACFSALGCSNCVLATLEGPGITQSECPVCKQPGWKKDLRFNHVLNNVVERVGCMLQLLEMPAGEAAAVEAVLSSDAAAAAARVSAAAEPAALSPPSPPGQLQQWHARASAGLRLLSPPQLAHAGGTAAAGAIYRAARLPRLPILPPSPSLVLCRCWRCWRSWCWSRRRCGRTTSCPAAAAHTAAAMWRERTCAATALRSLCLQHRPGGGRRSGHHCRNSSSTACAGSSAVQPGTCR